MATDMIARAMAAEAGSTDGVKNALTDTTAPEWTPAEQLAARQRLGLDKEWVLVGTITGDETGRGNIDTGVDVDLTGCTEVKIIGVGNATSAPNIRFNDKNIISGVPTVAGNGFVCNVQNSSFGIISTAKRSSMAVTSLDEFYNANVSLTTYEWVDGSINIQTVTSIKFSISEYVTSCDIKIYAR